MRICDVKDIEIGVGKPKICLPIVVDDDQMVLKTLETCGALPFDLLELRIDFYQDILDEKKLLQLLRNVRQVTDKPLLFTYRSQREGGHVQLTDEQYRQLVHCVCQSQLVDLIDIEVMSGNALVYEFVTLAHQYHIKAVLSYHDFEATPGAYEMEDILEKMAILGGDILKIAVMPQKAEDVILVINTTIKCAHVAPVPIVMIAMGERGTLTRISGELTGSAMTFACLDDALAPGQIQVNRMDQLLSAIHQKES